MPFRTGVLTMSIALLVAILVFGASFIVSVSQGITRASERLGADLLVVPVGAREVAQEVLLETKVKVFYMKRDIIEQVRKIEGVKELSYQTYLSTIQAVCCDIPSAKVVMFDQDTDFIVRPWLNKTLGRKLEKGEVIIGRGAYENFDLLDVDRSVFFNIVFDIVGILERTGTGLDNAILMGDENLKDIIASTDVEVKEDDVSVIFVKVREGYNPEQVGRKVENAILKVDVISRNDMGQQIIENLKDINSIFFITIALASLLSISLAWSVFSAIANERVKEIGIMRAIGARGSHVITLFVFEVLALAITGSLIGIGIGTYMSQSLSDVFVLLQELTVSLTSVEMFGIALMGLFTGTSICLLGALSSIVRLSGREPFTAIKEI
jgi:putative ABC transport system permease protein